MADDTQGWTLVEEPSMAVSHEPVRPDTSTGLKLAVAGKAIPLAATAAMEVATHPGAAKAGATLGQLVGGIEGALKGGPMGAAGGAWTGGKAGWFTGKLAQKIAAPLAKAATAAAPYAQTLSTLSGAASIGNLAQMAEPERRDIGFLGIGASMPNIDVLTAAVKKGANPTQAAAQLAKGDPKKFAQLVTAYSQSLRQGQ